MREKGFPTNDAISALSGLNKRDGLVRLSERKDMPRVPAPDPDFLRLDPVTRYRDPILARWFLPHASRLRGHSDTLS